MDEQVMAEESKEKIPGDQNIIGATDMCLDPIGMVWMKDRRGTNTAATTAPYGP